MSAVSGRRLSLRSLPAVWVSLLATTLAFPSLADVSVTFRRGESPTPTYDGFEDVRVEDGRFYMWQAAVNYDRQQLLADSFPASNRGLLRFDLSSIPSTATVTAVTLHLYVENPSGPANTPDLFPLLKPWTENGVTWLTTNGATPWQTPGAAGAADRGAKICDLDVSATGPSACTFNATAVNLVDGWVQTPSTNHGFLMAEVSPDAGGWASSEDVDVTRRPRLQVTYNQGGTTTVSFQQGVAGYSGCTDANIGSGPDPRTVNFAPETGAVSPATAASTSSTLYKLDPTGFVPPWAKVTGASLEVTPRAMGYPLSLHAQRRAWTRTGATWLTTDGTTPWEVDGGFGDTDRDPQPLTTAVTGAPDTVLSLPLPASALLLVESWLQGGPNHGLRLEAGAGASSLLPLDGSFNSQPPISKRPGFTLQYVEGLVRARPLTADAGSPAVHAFALERTSLTSMPLPASIPSLEAQVFTVDGELSDQPSGPWASSVLTFFAAGATQAPPLYARNLDGGAVRLTLDAGVAWQVEDAALGLPDGPDGGEVDGGTEGSTPGDPGRYSVGCSTSAQLGGAALLLLVAAARLPRRRRRGSGRA